MSFQSPYQKPGRLADIVAAIQIMGAYTWASREVKDWAKKLCTAEVPSASDITRWTEVFQEHPEFFRLTQTGWASLRWRHGYDRNYHVTQEKELTQPEILALTEKQREDDLTRKVLTADQIEALMKTAIEFHSREIAQSQENRWRLMLLVGLITPILAFIGAIAGAAIKGG